MRNSNEPKWQEPLEWMSVGALLMVIFLVVFVY